MASLGDSPNPWASSYDTYRDCSQGLCSIYCPQWCYIIFPPPPPDFGDLADGGGGDDGDGSSSNFSPLIIAVIGILASAFILLSYYTIIAKYCRRRRAESERELSGAADEAGSAAAAIGAEGLEEGLIKAIRVYKYRKSDGVVDCADCAVCLSEFEDNEGLRLLPKCNHAFHVPCIDTWLKSHSTCPLCRAHIAPFAAAEDDVVVVVAAAVSSAPAVVVVVEAEEERDSSVGVVNEESSEPKISVVDDRTVGMRRSVSLNGGRGFCADRVLVADILREQEDDDDDEMVGNFGMQMGLGIGTSSSSKAGFDDDDDDHNNDQICKWERSGALGLMRSPVAIRRSVSSGRFVFTR